MRGLLRTAKLAVSLSARVCVCSAAGCCKKKKFYGVYEVASDAKNLQFRARPLAPLGKRKFVALGL